VRFFNKLGGLLSSPASSFDKIDGYDDVKDIVRHALDSEDNYNLLLSPPASAKTLFLQGILDIRKDGVYFDGSNTTSRILDVLEEKRPKIICIDEIDKMPRTFHQLLNFMESGRVKVDQMKRSYDFEIRSQLVLRDGFRCRRCKQIPLFPTLDHILPKGLGGYQSPYSLGSQNYSYHGIMKNSS